jgi:hypothetical protein
MSVVRCRTETAGLGKCIGRSKSLCAVIRPGFLPSDIELQMQQASQVGARGSGAGLSELNHHSLLAACSADWRRERGENESRIPAKSGESEQS